MTTFWHEASRDLADEEAQRLFALATVAVEQFQPFLCAATSPDEYQQRKAVSQESVQRVLTATLDDERIVSVVTPHIWADFDQRFAESYRERAYARLARMDRTSTDRVEVCQNCMQPIQWDPEDWGDGERGEGPGAYLHVRTLDHRCDPDDPYNFNSAHPLYGACQNCGGTGAVDGDECPTCDGAGVKHGSQRLGLSEADAKFLWQHAYDYDFQGRHDPTEAEEYAGWYMANYGDAAETLVDVPDHPVAHQKFLDSWDMSDLFGDLDVSSSLKVAAGDYRTDYKPGQDCPYCGADSSRVKQTARGGESQINGVDRYKCEDCFGGMSDSTSWKPYEGSLHTAADSIECITCAAHGMFNCAETVGKCDLCGQTYDVFRDNSKTPPETVCLKCLIDGKHMKSAHEPENVKYLNELLPGRGISAMRHTAPGGGEHAPYRIEEQGGKWYVVNDLGERKNEDGYATKDEARELQKALYANVPGASESADKKSSLRTASTKQITVGWTLNKKYLTSEERNLDPDGYYSSFMDGYRDGQPQETQTFTVETDVDDASIPEAVFMATNAPHEVDGIAKQIRDAITASGYTGRTSQPGYIGHYSLSVGDTVIVNGTKYECKSMGFGKIADLVPGYSGDGREHDVDVTPDHTPRSSVNLQCPSCKSNSMEPHVKGGARYFQCLSCGHKALPEHLIRANLKQAGAAWGRRHYEDLASRISELPDGEREKAAKHFSEQLVGTNPNYRKDQFYTAASSPNYRVRGGTGTANYSRQHYQRVADAIGSYGGDKAALTKHFSDHFQSTNARFKPSTFERAVSKKGSKIGAADSISDVIAWCRRNATMADTASVSRVSGTDVLRLLDAAGPEADDDYVRRQAEMAGTASVSRVSGTDLLRICDLAEANSKTAVNTDAYGADRYQRTRHPNSQWSTDEYNEGSAGRETLDQGRGSHVNPDSMKPLPGIVRVPIKDTRPGDADLHLYNTGSRTASIEMATCKHCGLNISKEDYGWAHDNSNAPCPGGVGEAEPKDGTHRTVSKRLAEEPSTLRTEINGSTVDYDRDSGIVCWASNYRALDEAAQHEGAVRKVGSTFVVSTTPRRAPDRLSEIMAGIRKTNPSISEEMALRVAKRTLKVVGEESWRAPVHGSPEKCMFCDNPATSRVKWWSQSGNSLLGTYYVCNDHRDAGVVQPAPGKSLNWSNV